MSFFDWLGFFGWILAITSPITIGFILVVFGKDIWDNRYSVAFWKTAYIGDRFHQRDNAWSVIEITDRKSKYAKFVVIKENGERHTYVAQIALKDLFLNYSKETK